MIITRSKVPMPAATRLNRDAAELERPYFQFVPVLKIVLEPPRDADISHFVKHLTAGEVAK